MTSPDPTLRAAPMVEDADRALRPQALEEFVGQAEARANLRVFIESAKMRGQAMDHTLFHGPPGLGKTTLAQIMARELGVNFRMTSGPVLAKAGDLAAILTNLEARDVLFIDEIHRLNPAVEEVLYPAMEDFELDLVIGEGPAARTMRIELQPFTLVGATTRMGLLTTPLRDRFGIPVRLQFDPHGARGRALADHKIQLEILHRGVQDLFDRGVHAVDFIDKQNVPRLKVGEDCRQIPRLGQDRTRGHAKIHAQLTRHDLRERRFTQPRRTVEQRVVHRLAPHFR